MSSQADLYINKYSVISQTSFILPEMAMIFREGDKKIFKKKIDGELHTFYKYSNTVRNIKDRLEVMGYSINKVKTEFEKDILQRISEIEEEIEDCSYEDLRKEYEYGLDVLKKSSFKSWQKAFKYIMDNKLFISYWTESEYKAGTPKLVKYILNHIDYGTLYNYPGGDIYSILRIFLEACSDDLIVELDLTELINSGWYEPNQEVCKDVIDSAKKDYPLNEKIIILTEGSSDRYILESSLRLLYPHLFDYYSFMNFSDSNAQGGSGALVETIRSFVGSGITNRVVAIFDNDTAGTDAIKTLERTKIPPNIKIIQYPYFPFAKNYPTQGPSGISVLDINGLAGSIEIYLGKDILELKKKLIPVQWKGYNNRLKQYQGEIIDKAKVQNEFREKLKKCETNHKLVEKMDWSGLILIFQSIFKVFQ